MGYETENTIASIEKAIELGVSIIEIDVLRIKSGELMVFHDKRVDRLTNGAGEIEDYYMSDVLALNLVGGHKIPTLQQVLKAVDGRVKINIELKGKRTASKVDQIIRVYERREGYPLSNYVISSFDWEELDAFRALNQEVDVAVLTDADPLQAIPKAQELNAVAINPYYKNINAKIVKQIHEAGFKVYTYTVNEEADITSVKEMGVDGIFCDYPDRAL
jgi:glycerophosphoryl diester phosphodiesterase